MSNTKGKIFQLPFFYMLPLVNNLMRECLFAPNTSVIELGPKAFVVNVDDSESYRLFRDISTVVQRHYAYAYNKNYAQFMVKANMAFDKLAKKTPNVMHGIEIFNPATSQTFWMHACDRRFLKKRFHV